MGRFIVEWASACLKAEYRTIQRQSGSNDKGIDIAGFANGKRLMGVWDNYQCKHDDHALHPVDAWPELGKILWHSFTGRYAPPRSYFFVAPRGTGTTLSQPLANPAALRTALLEVWDTHCRDHITKTQAVGMDGDFAAYVAGFDFSLFKSKSTRDILDQHRSTPYFIPRFGGGLPGRPTPGAPPEEVAGEESVYIAKLLDAYSDHTKEPVKETKALKKWSKLQQHFNRQREAFYHAESLRVFVRDKVEPGTFESLQHEIYQGWLTLVTPRILTGMNASLPSPVRQ